MEYQKLINLIHDTTNQQSKFRARHQVEINYESKGKYDKVSKIHDKVKFM